MQYQGTLNWYFVGVSFCQALSCHCASGIGTLVGAEVGNNEYQAFAVCFVAGLGSWREERGRNMSLGSTEIPHLPISSFFKFTRPITGSRK